MTGSPSELRRVLLDLGMEDDIPFPEAMCDREVLAAVADTEAVGAVMAELTALVQAHKLLIYSRPWDADGLDLLSVNDAVALMQDPRWYRYRLGEPHEVRLYFGNVDNISMEYFGYPDVSEPG